MEALLGGGLRNEAILAFQALVEAGLEPDETTCRLLAGPIADLGLVPRDGSIPVSVELLKQVSRQELVGAASFALGAPVDQREARAARAQQAGLPTESAEAARSGGEAATAMDVVPGGGVL